MIKAVIIDDEQAMLELNSALLAQYFPEIYLAGTAYSVATGLEVIRTNQPDLVLLDIELNNEMGFQILQELKPYSFKVVFITGHDSFAIKAIKFSALDYILKPVNEIEFQQALRHAIELIESKESTQLQVEVLMDSFRKEMQTKKLVLRTSTSLHIVDISDIFFCESDNSYTTFYLHGDEKIVVSKSMKDYEKMLRGFGFFRSHQSFLVNLNHVKKVDKSDGGYVIMKNKKEIPVSLRQKKNLIKMLEQF